METYNTYAQFKDMKKKENDHLDDKEEDDECMSRWFIFLMCSQFGSMVCPGVMENKAWEN